MATLKIKELHKRFGTVEVLKGIDIEVAPGALGPRSMVWSGGALVVTGPPGTHRPLDPAAMAGEVAHQDRDLRPCWSAPRPRTLIVERRRGACRSTAIVVAWCRAGAHGLPRALDRGGECGRAVAGAGLVERFRQRWRAEAAHGELQSAGDRLREGRAFLARFRR